jgi:hypothetical protein
MSRVDALHISIHEITAASLVLFAIAMMFNHLTRLPLPLSLSLSLSLSLVSKIGLELGIRLGLEQGSLTISKQTVYAIPV